MFDNIGRKVKILAIVTCVIGVLGSVIGGIVILYNNSYMEVPGILTMVLGSLFSWISSWVMYAIGEAAETANKNAYVLAELQKKLQANGNDENSSQERISGHAPNFGKNTPSYVTGSPADPAEKVALYAEKIPCPKCGAMNKKTFDKCFVCDADLK